MTEPKRPVPPKRPKAEEDSASIDLTGRTLGDYRLLRRLGRGGMAEVYLAEQASLKRQVAIKTLRKQLAGDANYVKRFTHEARAAAKLVHAHIVQIYEVGCLEGIHFIAQEYVPGQNLRQLLARLGRPLDPKRAVSIIRQTASALQKAGEQGIVHRDVKPENIMITPTGEVKVADFGLARITGGDDAVTLTQVGMTMGTPLYMSPEQAEGKPVDPRSDIYSFGATCFHMLAGHPPYTGDSPLAVAVQHVKGTPPELSAIRPDLPPGLCRIVMTMLAKKPGDRFAGGAEIVRALRALRAEGVSDEVLDGLDDWTTMDFPAVASRTALPATMQLTQVLQTQAVRSRRRVGWWIVPVGIAAGLLLGTLLGFATVPSLPLK